MQSAVQVRGCAVLAALFLLAAPCTAIAQGPAKTGGPSAPSTAQKPQQLPPEEPRGTGGRGGEASAASLGPLAPHARLSPQGRPWRVTAGPGGELLAENETSAAGVTWFVMPSPGPRPLQVSVHVTTEAPPLGGPPGDPALRRGAGLIYGLEGEGQNSSFYALLLQPDGTLSVLRRTPEEGIRSLISQRSGSVDTTRPVELRIVETGRGGAEFHLAGRRVAMIEGPAFGRGTVGVTAFGTGRHSFRNFRLGAATAAADPRADLPAQAAPPAEATAGKPAEQPEPWGQASGPLRLHRDPRGFSVMLPAGWRVEAPTPNEIAVLDPGTGAAALVRGRVAAGDLATWLARAYPATEPGVTQASALAVEPAGAEAARATFRATDREGRQLRAHAVAVRPRSGDLATVFVAAAPEASFGNQLPVLASILDSFRFEAPPATTTQPPPAARLDWTRWRDPQEAAFEVDIPQGWRPQGGMLRQHGYTRPTFDLTSPDGRIRLMVGDAAAPRFIIPSPLLLSLGNAEGQPVRGSPGLVMLRFRPAAEAAADLATRRFGRIEVLGLRDRPDLAAFRRQNQPQGVPGTVAMLTAADLEFRVADGRLGALSLVTAGWDAPGLVGGWGIDESYAFLAPPELTGLAGAALARVVGSLRVNPIWLAAELRGQRADSEAWIAYLNRSAELRQSTLEQRWAVQGRQGREWRDAVGNVARLVDPQTREEIEVQRTGRYFFRSTIPHRPGVVSTETDWNPEPIELRRMLEMGRDLPYR